MKRAFYFAATSAVALAVALPAAAEIELSFYTGFQEAAHSRVRGTDPTAAGDFNFLSTWEGRSFEMPPYYGLRGTWWQSERLGFGLEFTHSKVYASDGTLARNGLETLEFTDGINVLTANVMYRIPNQSAFTPYVGAGLGFNMPHVEFKAVGGAETFEYQIGGPSAALSAGVSYKLNETWALFGEWRGIYSKIDVDLDGGGSLKTNVITNSVNIGLSYTF